MKEISYNESRSIPDSVYIDVRSPGEFRDDHVPGSVNIALFDNEERKEVGTIYRMAGRDEAVMRGTEIVGDKLKELVGSFLAYGDKNIIVLCARGGMRSTSLASLLDTLGLKVYKLRNGYKGYRQYVIERMESLSLSAPLFVLQGLTGAGKTEIIRMAPTAIDLEEMAGHRSSVFGGIGLAQETQKMFESRIIGRIQELETAPYCLIEGESRKIGNLHLPDPLYGLMMRAPAIYIDTPLERRVDIIFSEYHSHCDNTNIPTIVRSLESKLGRKNADLLINLYTGGHIREFIRVMLEKYYDPLYRHSLDRKNYIAIIENRDTGETVLKVHEAIESFLAHN
ncbi:MAG: tRNA 2-selenouridine(34) synthase MnmH [Spirochaetes bacterium]|nr:tRNA 2-selenouridine(34) synthase MnmH [Spirochaetota bacterium]